MKMKEHEQESNEHTRVNSLYISHQLLTLQLSIHEGKDREVNHTKPYLPENFDLAKTKSWGGWKICFTPWLLFLLAQNDRDPSCMMTLGLTLLI